jgi:hypothetical protein
MLSNKPFDQKPFKKGLSKVDIHLDGKANLRSSKEGPFGYQTGQKNSFESQIVRQTDKRNRSGMIQANGIEMDVAGRTSLQKKSKTGNLASSQLSATKKVEMIPNAFRDNNRFHSQNRTVSREKIQQSHSTQKFIDIPSGAKAFSKSYEYKISDKIRSNVNFFSAH